MTWPRKRWKGTSVRLLNKRILSSSMEDPFPEAPSYEELERMKEPMDEYDDIVEFSEANRDWYNEAILVAARIMVEVAAEHEEFRQHLLDGGSAHDMKKYDEQQFSKLMEMGLSANRGGTAERAAADFLERQ